MEMALKSNYPWWFENSLYSIPKLWLLKSEQTVIVALLDTGISDHIDFDFSKITGFNYLTQSAEYKTDIHGHGTHCAGLIASCGKKSYGIAPETNLFVAKVCDDKGRPIIDAVKNVLEDIYFERNGCKGVRIINMSFNLAAQSEEEFNKMRDIENLLIKLSTEKQCIIVCSCGSIDDIDDSFPARVNDCIAVGSINSEFKRSTFSRITPILDILAPGESILSSNDTDLVKFLSGTSQATAFISGVCSLAIQKIKKTVAADSFKKILYQTAYSESFLLQEYGHGIINPNKLVETILKY